MALAEFVLALRWYKPYAVHRNYATQNMRILGDN